MQPLLAFHLPFLDQSAVLLIIGLLIFGKRLPEVGRSLGKGIVEFKRGIKGIEDDVESAASVPAPPVAAPALSAPSAVAQTSFKFDPHTGQPIQPPVPPGAKFDPYTGQPIAAATVVPQTVDAEVIEPSATTPLRGY
jgi:sec-independent protein translocase protein TatA